jgi:hypothetical protein
MALTSLWMMNELARGAVSLPFTGGFIVLAIVILGGWWMSRSGTMVMPFLLRRGVNLEATRGIVPPIVWLVAHIDSKSQIVPMFVRIVGVVICSASWGTMLILRLLSSVGRFPIPISLYLILVLLSMIGSIPLVLSFIGNRGTGALDNASGVATILGALDYIDQAIPLGILISSAEELGLAGARAWVKGRPRAVAINCDSIDDTGGLLCMLSRGGRRSLAMTLRRASKRAGVHPIISGTIPGVLVDAIAFSEAGWSALTVSRGGWSSLARIHTRRDTLEGMIGTGIPESARFVAALVGSIIAEGVGDTE